VSATASIDLIPLPAVGDNVVMDEANGISIRSILWASFWLWLAVAAGSWCVDSIDRTPTATLLAFLVTFGCLGSAIAALRGRTLLFIASRWATFAVFAAAIVGLQFAFAAIFH
jgi:hypothetical protein